jgi:hypothetical protein
VEQSKTMSHYAITLPVPDYIYGNLATVVSHDITREQWVPPQEIDRAIERKNRFTA